MERRHIPVEGGYNVRDLGGLPTASGGTTRFGSLIRAGNLDQVTEAGQQTLLTYGLKTVIDLRSSDEVRQWPDVFAASRQVSYWNLPYSPNDYAGGADYRHLHELYCQSLDARRENIRMIISTIAESEPGILFHCAVGKDRTGMIAALLLDLVGVPAEVIAEDYAETTRHILKQVEAWRDYLIENGEDMTYFERDYGAVAPTMLTTLDFLDRDYGGAEAYLRWCGVSAAQVARLKTLLVDERHA